MTRGLRLNNQAPIALGGKWRAIDSEETLVLLKDETCQGRDWYGRKVGGNYALIDSGHHRLDLTVATVNKERGTLGIDHSSGICGIELQNNQLTLADEAGAAKRYARLE